MKIAVVSNTDWSLYNFRRNLMAALQAAGHEVIAIAPPGQYGGRLTETGFPFRAIAISGDGTNPLKELGSVIKLRRLFRREGVDVVLSYTPKGNIYSALALVGLEGRLVTNVSGLGYAFIRDSWLARFVQQLYRLSFKRASWVFFQNEDDRSIFLKRKLVDPERTSRLPGSGVDLNRFAPKISPDPDLPAKAGNGRPNPEALVFLLVARMVWDKGVGEFVEAARLVKTRFPQARFQLLGFRNVSYPAVIPSGTLDAWMDEGIIEYLGSTDDVTDSLLRADCVVLPSYREGVPRSMLEAAACGKPLITTDVPGCRDVVDDGVNGYLCEVRNPRALADAISRFCGLSVSERVAMGAESRRKVEREFDEGLVIDQYLGLLRRLPMKSEGGQEAHVSSSR